MTEGRAPVDCPECGTENLAASRFCESCGLRLVVAGSERRSRPTRGRRRADKSERIEIERKLRTARTVLRSMRWLYGVLALASALFFLAALKLESAWLTTMLAAQTLLLIAGAVFLYVQPLGFALVLACLMTVVLVVDVAVIGQLTVGVVVDAFVTLCLWCAVPVVVGVARLQREFPDLVDTEKLKRRRKFDEAPGSAALARAESRRSDARRASLRTFAIVAGAVLLVVGLWIPIRAATRDAEPGGPKTYTVEEIAAIERKLGPAVARFIMAWGANDTEAVAAMFPEDRRITFWPKVERTLSRHGWSERLPDLDTNYQKLPGSFEDQEVRFDLEARGTLRTHWTWDGDGGAWVLRRIGFRDLR